MLVGSETLLLLFKFLLPQSLLALHLCHMGSKQAGQFSQWWLHTWPFLVSFHHLFFSLLLITSILILVRGDGFRHAFLLRPTHGIKKTAVWGKQKKKHCVLYWLDPTAATTCVWARAVIFLCEGPSRQTREHKLFHKKWVFILTQKSFKQIIKNILN